MAPGRTSPPAARRRVRCSSPRLRNPPDLLAETIHRHRPELTSVSGPYTATARFASQWRALTGNEPVETMRMRLHRLDTVHPPTGVQGTARPATMDDRTVLTSWLAAMREEALPHEPDTELGPIVDRGLARGAYWLSERM